jgi:hypothetical protein
MNGIAAAEQPDQFASRHDNDQKCLKKSTKFW